MDIYNNEGKSDVSFRDYKCKEALYYLKRRGLPYSFDLNIYLGCSHNCQYCYARKSHILPFLSDDRTSMEKMVKRASEVKVDYMLSGVLYLSGGIKERYLSFIKREFPEYYSAYVELYPRGKANPDYKSRIHSFLRRMREKYGVNAQYSKIIPSF